MSELAARALAIAPEPKPAKKRRKVARHFSYHDGERLVDIWFDDAGRELTDEEAALLLAAERGEARILWPPSAHEPDPRFGLTAMPAWLDNGWPRHAPPDRHPAVWLTQELGARVAAHVWRANGGWAPLHDRRPEQATPYGQTKEAA